VRRLVELTGILARRCAQLQRALESRILIEQAKGILSERYGLGVDDAFDALRRTARSNRIKLRDLAEEVVASGSTPVLLHAQFDRTATSAASARRRGRIQAHPRS
jgi:AmiR/NasT family two-component response regulator